MTQIPNVALVIPASSISGNALSGNAEILHTQMRQRVLQPYPVNWANFRVWDAQTSNPVSTAASDDLALLSAAFTASGASTLISAGDCKNLGATTRRVAFFAEVPAEYDDGETIQIRIRAFMSTTVASTSCTVDLEAFIVGSGSTVGSDLVTTAATTMNSLTASDKDFFIDGPSVNPGDLLLCRLTILCNDTATATAVTPTVSSVVLLCDTRG